MIASTQTQDEFPGPGELFAERYRIIELVGTGGFSRVYSARQQQLDRLVAVKILAPRGGGSRSSREIIEKRFYREARLLSRLSGPNTITVYDYGRTSDGLLFMVSELIEGQNLKHLLEQEGPLESTRARRIFTQILLGLREVHSHGFLHRDIKPSNVMVFDQLGERDSAKLLDFGIAKGVTVGATDDTALTMTGFVIGTPGYMSPEQALGRPVTRASDLFSAGLIAYEMLTGQSPFRGLSMEQLQRRLMSAPLRLPGTVKVGADFERVLNRVLSIEAAERYETAAGALADLGLLEPVPPPRDPRPRTPRPTNLLTFPMQLDSSGSTIVDTIADGPVSETTTIMLPGADTFEEHRGSPEVSDTAETNPEPIPADGSTEDDYRAKGAGDSTVVAPAQADRSYGLIIWLVGFGIVAAVAAVVLLSGSEESDEVTEPVEPTDSVTSPQPPPDLSAATEEARAIRARSARNAELDAEIRAKELILEREPADGTPVDDPAGERSKEQDRKPDTAADVPAKPAPASERGGSEEKSRATRPARKPDRDRKPARKPEKRDFDVTPLDEL